MDRRVFLYATLGAAALPLVRAAAAPLPVLDDLRQRIRAIMAALRVPGAGVALVRDGRMVLAEGFGLSSIPFAAPATARSLFHLGSVSKQFTAATVVALAREGRFDLDEPIGARVKDLPPSLSGLAIRALLGHISGIPDYEGLAGFDADRAIEHRLRERNVGLTAAENCRR